MQAVAAEVLIMDPTLIEVPVAQAAVAEEHLVKLMGMQAVTI
jgi:hypothetical protein